ncbi:MAG TPA: nitroreductase, partial [Sedimenticola sp.]|nr:nitroreductase [Sedimenticola sp.]
HSTRAFLPRPVTREQILRILDAARHAPSGTNIQPWQVAVVTGEMKQQLQERLQAAFAAGEKGVMDYQYYPLKWEGPYRERRKACGLQLYSALNIAREEKERQRALWAANYRAFDAPVMLLFFMDPLLETGSYLDYGMFLQSIMLMAVEEGLATCPQASLAEYPAIVKETLGYPAESVLVCGMALGYEDTEAPINGYRTSREAVERFTRFFGE